MRRSHVLVIEDDNDIRQELAELLEENGYCAVLADHGQHALELLRAGNRADAIILDLMMPVMDGWEFRQRQKGDPALAPIPVIVTTATDAAVDAEVCLRKPIDTDALLRALEEHAGRQ